MTLNSTSKKVLIGKIISAFGIKGEVKILSYLDNPLKIEKYKIFDALGNSLSIKISNKGKAAIGSNSSGEAVLIAKIDGVLDRTAAEKLRGTDLYADRKNFPSTKSDEFYYADLVVLDVIDMSSKKIGKVLNVLDYGAGGIIEIEFDEINPEISEEKIESFSFRDEIFPEINLEAGFLRIDPPEIAAADL